MAIKINGVVYRNLQQQVAYLSNKVAELEQNGFKPEVVMLSLGDFPLVDLNDADRGMGFVGPQKVVVDLRSYAGKIIKVTGTPKVCYNADEDAYISTIVFLLPHAPMNTGIGGFPFSPWSNMGDCGWNDDYDEYICIMDEWNNDADEEALKEHLTIEADKALIFDCSSGIYCELKKLDKAEL